VSAVLSAPFAAPLVAAALGVLLRGHRGAQRAISAALVLLLLVDGVRLVDATRDGAAIATRVGDWPAGLGIPFAADGFSALLVVVMTTMAGLALVFAAARGEDRHPLFHPMAAVLLAGVLGSVVTADLFNLFVTFEVMLIGSYVLLTLRGGRRQVRAGTIYVGVNLLASTLFLIGVGLVYATAGTVAFADLAVALTEAPGTAVGLGVVAVAIGVKASLVPMHAWLPRTYVEAGPAVTALFSGLLTKAGVYVLLRLSSVALGDAPAIRSLLLGAAVLTMVVGVLGAIGRDEVRGILAFHMVSQVGYLLLPLGIWTVAGVTAGIVYLLQYVLVKGALFLAAGTIETLTGTGKLKDLGGMVRTRPLLALGFLLPALSLGGIPPTSGFVGKFLLIRAAFLDAHWVAGGVAVAVSLFTLLSMVKIWGGVFWGEPTEAVELERHGTPLGLPVLAGGAGSDDPPSLVTTTSPPLSRWALAGMLGPTLLVGVAVVALGLAAQPLLELVEPAARTLIDPTPYLEAVRGA
jgi:multicomponent Na+:H+ antiporter subunit D